MGLPVSSEGNASDGCFVPLQTLTTSCCNLCNLNGGLIAKAADPAFEFGQRHREGCGGCQTEASGYIALFGGEKVSCTVVEFS